MLKPNANRVDRERHFPFKDENELTTEEDGMHDFNLERNVSMEWDVNQCKLNFQLSTSKQLRKGVTATVFLCLSNGRIRSNYSSPSYYYLVFCKYF